MPINPPQPIAAYFSAGLESPEAFGKCFTANATVIDERNTYLGREAIQRWNATSAAKYNFVAEPTATENREGRIVVTARVSGNFPGSPVDLRYTFTLDGDEISRLEIEQ